MYRLAILFLISQILIVSGLLKTNNDISSYDDNFINCNGFKPKPVEGRSSENGLKKPLWVLNLESDLDFLKLRRGSRQEEKDFDNVTPTIQRLVNRQRKVVKKDNPERPKQKEEEHRETEEDRKNNNLLKREIMKVVNKFVLSTNREPDSYLSESDSADEPSLALYFRGPFTSLTLKYGRWQWHFFVGPPSPLPAWFYRPQDSDVTQGASTTSEDFKIVPVNIRSDFYKALLHLLRMFLSYPI